MNYSLVDSFVFFFIYGFLGFLLETIFRSLVEKKKVVSRGFLTNMFCPLYGLCGILIIEVFTLSEVLIYSRFLELIVGTVLSIILVSFMEYSTGRLLDKVFHHKMWDYSHLPFNLHSYICLDFSLMWGILAIILSSIINPVIEIFVFNIPQAYKMAFIYIVSSILYVNATYNIRKFYNLEVIRL